MKTARYLLLLATVLITNSVYALPSANGSFAAVQFGTITTTGSGAWEIGVGTTSVTVTSSHFISSTSDPYLGDPNNMSILNPPGTISDGDLFSLSSNTFSTAGVVGTPFALGTPLDFTVASYTFRFITENIISRVNGNIGLQFSGYLFDDASGFLEEGTGELARFSVSFTQSSIGGSKGASYSLDAPPEGTGGGTTLVPEPEMLGLLGIGLAGFGMIARRKRKVVSSNKTTALM